MHDIFYQTRIDNPKIYMEPKKKKERERELLLKPGKKEQSWRHKPSRFQMI